MAETVSVRLNQQEREALKRAAQARGVGISTCARLLVREGLGFREENTDSRFDDLAGQIEGLERRLSRVEEVAHL